MSQTGTEKDHHHAKTQAAAEKPEGFSLAV
jgi:hypothetical protein